MNFLCFLMQFKKYIGYVCVCVCLCERERDLSKDYHLYPLCLYMQVHLNKLECRGQVLLFQ